MGENLLEKVIINALQYKKDSSGIGVMIRELFSRYASMSDYPCEIVLCRDIGDFPADGKTSFHFAPCGYEQGLRRMFYQLFELGRRCDNALLLTTDAKTPLFMPRSCRVIPLVTDLALYRMPEAYQSSRVLLWKLQYRYLRRRACRFLAISEFTKHEITEILDVPQEKIDVVPCACSEQMRRVTDQQKLWAIREAYQIPERFVLFVGNTNPRKNLKRIIQAFDEVKEQGFPHQLIIAGGQGWKFNRESVLSDIYHKEAVRFIGFVPDEDMPALYSAADVFLFPTLYEGFGIPVLEAQQCGTPVLTSNGSSLPEVGGDGALYVDPYSVEDIAKGLRCLLEDRELAAALVKKGYRNAERYSWRAAAEKLNKIVVEEFR